MWFHLIMVTAWKYSPFQALVSELDLNQNSGFSRTLDRDLYIDIKPTPSSWHCFWFLLNSKVSANLCKHFFNVRKTFPNFSRSRQKLFFFTSRKIIAPLKQTTNSAHITVSCFWKVGWCMTCFFHGTQLKRVTKWSELLWFSLVKKQLWKTVIW